MAYVRAHSGLASVPVSVVLKQLGANAEDGRLTREHFQTAHVSLLREQRIDVPVDNVLGNTFDVFDRDGNGVIDLMELVCGAAILCKGSSEEKITAVFGVLSSQQKDSITMDDLFMFLTAVFTMVLDAKAIAKMRSSGIDVSSPDDLASVTALEVFKSATLNSDGRLPLSEFKAIFGSPKFDPTYMFGDLCSVTR